MPPASKKPTPWKLFFVVSFLITIIAVVVAVTFVIKFYRVTNPDFQQQIVQQETEKLLREVGSMYLLPPGTPQIAVVSDPEALKKGQPFFDKAIEGDRIIIYPDQAILYRTSTKQIINIGPVSAPASEESI